ncbi:MAG TPA: SdpA family antimicrobial peptide system protein [Pseudonocardiaceae bacterium]|jgi:antimicrobial peptide system SdpA family protein|nr:SdpA family antimicrobial peptide system protein [Pseudonocardiaceae bacterium]
MRPARHSDRDSETGTETGEPDSALLARRGLWFLVTAALLVVGIAYVALCAVPPTAVGTPSSARTVAAFLPEGWAFFTKSPQSAVQTPWTDTGAGWRSASIGSNSSPANGFGISRAVRSQNVELGRLYEETASAKLAWTNCGPGDVVHCVAAAAVAGTVHNGVSDPTLCGDVAISETTPLPWAWSQRYTQQIMPTRVMKVRVTC